MFNNNNSFNINRNSNNYENKNNLQHSTNSYHNTKTQNITPDKKLKGYIIASILFLILGGIFIVLQINYMKSTCYTTATITRITDSMNRDYSDANADFSVTFGSDDTDYYKKDYTELNYYITYEVDGIIYEDVKINFKNSSMHLGQTITITYDPDNPGQPKGNLFVFLIVAIVFIGFGITAIVLAIKEKKKI